MTDIELPAIAARLLLATLCGLLLGLDRDMKNKPVDFRAYIIVSVTSALAALVSLKLLVLLPERSGLGMDPSRVIQAVLLGIAFLGSATIIKRDDRVIGTATGATVWAAGGIGLTLGYGFYALGLIAFLCVFLTLVIMGFFVGAHDTLTKEKHK